MTPWVPGRGQVPRVEHTEGRLPKPRRTTSRSHYEKIPSRVLQPKPGAMSARALGVLCHLLSQPPDWVSSAERLAFIFKEGRDAMEKALRELQELGYLARHRVPLGGGRWTWLWIFGDDPELVARDLALKLAEYSVKQDTLARSRSD
jgi:predicted transcriptional regulator